MTKRQEEIAKVLYSAYYNSNDRTPRGRFKIAVKEIEGFSYTMIEQNPNSRSVKGAESRELAKEHEVVQVKKDGQYGFIGRFVDGKFEYYP